MRGVLDVCSRIGRMCYRGVVVTVHKRVRLIAVMLVLSLLIAALPASSSSALAARAAGTVSEESLPLHFYRSVQSTFAAIGMWMAENLRSNAAAPPTASTYEPVTAHLSPEPPFIDAPTGLTVTGAADASLSLSWTAPAGSVDHYQIERSQSIAGPFLFRANSATTTFNDTSVTTDQAYLYRVRAVTSGGLPSTPSNMALGTATTFEFSGAALTGKLGKKQHIYDIRTAINAVRTVAGLSAATWTRSDLTDLVIGANDVQELRNRLGEALTVLDISVGAYTDPTFTAGVTVIKGTHIDQLQVRSTRGSSNSSGPIDPDSSSARLDPLNETGGGSENPLSRNYNWNLPLVALPGRAGMDLGLTLSYNSLVWTKVGSSVSFDNDYGFPGPGFRLGFPVIQQPAYFNSEVGKNAYLMIGSDGSRTELRQVSTSGGGATLWEAADSSHLLLDTTTTPFTLRSTDGTQLRYELKGGEYQCTRITDRNGNYITVNYTVAGRIDEVIDTLGRSIDFVYDANGWLTQIKQLWNAGAVTQYWARFEYTDTTIDTNFPSLAVYGPADTTQIKTLSKVILPDDSYHQFSYTSWGQVWKITKYGSDNQPIKYRSYDLPQTGVTAHTDCPRFTARKDWAKYWNGDTDGTTATNEEVTTAFIVPVSDTWTMPDSTQLTGVRAQMTTADGTITKIYFVGTAGTASGWSRSLPILVDTVSGGVTQRRSVTTWTQDNTSVSYLLNPRVQETNVYDSSNRARRRIEYQQFTFTNGTNCWLPRDVFEYDSNASTVLRTTRTNYITSSAYSDRRILGLPGEKLLYEGDVNGSSPPLKSKLEFVYDEFTAFDSTNAPIQHDSAYAAHFVGRANLTKVIRYDVTGSASTSTSSKYNRAGGVISSKDAANHEIVISYSDSFSDGNNSRATFAYPTTMTDADGFSSTGKYNFDYGKVTSKRTPQPNQPNNVLGPERTFTYDSIGRLQQVTNLVNNAHTRFVYVGNQLKVEAYSTVQDGLGEASSFQITDGAGRVIGVANQHPGSTGGFSGKRTVYDVMGRVIKTSNPTETTASGTPFQWNTAGDDAAAGWLYTDQTYDWKGRPLRTTHPNTTYKEASYSGCGCAGGEVVTLTDEGTIDGGVEKRRQRKIYYDVLGRTVKTESLNWAGGSVYSATVNTYDAADQVTTVTQYAGPAVSGTTSQVTNLTYDGYGRMVSKHVPEQDIGTPTVWTYNADDTVNTVTDARGAIKTLTYNARHLVTGTSYSAPSPIPATPSVTYTYDAAGNRLTMTDGLGSTTYTRDSLSRVTAETRTFTGVGNYTLNYAYNLSDQLTSITDPSGAQVGYNYDLIGRLSSITGSNFASVSTYASSMQYRAWGDLKSLSYGNTRTLAMTYDANMKPATYEVPGVMKKGYTYSNDGRLKFTQDQLTTNSKFDRLYRYDHLGRVTTALSGLEAREQGTTNDRPYNETMTYDAFDHLTSREVFQWDRHDISIDTYTNNRRVGWSYDADGRILVGSNQYTYDAAGQVIKFGFGDPYESDQHFDGDGRTVKTVVRSFDLETSQWTTESINYLVRSSVLGGEVVTELNSVGAKERTFVHVGNDPFAIQSVGAGIQSVQWQHWDASRASFRPTDNTGAISLGKELDPFGADAGQFKPITWPQPSHNNKIEPFYTVPELNSDTQGCVLDRVPVPCEILNNLMEAGGVISGGLVNDNGKLRQPKDPLIPHGLGLFTTFEYHGKEDGLHAYRRIIATRPVVKLSQCLIDVLSPLFPGMDLSQVNIYTDGIPKVVEYFNTIEGGAGAVTWGNDVYFPENGYDPTTYEGVAAIAHELVHVWQYSVLGKAEFTRQYAEGYINNVRAQLPKDLKFPFSGYLMDTLARQAVEFINWVKRAAPSVDLDKAYREIPLEKEAYRLQKEVKEFFDEVKRYSGKKGPCP